MSARDRIMSLAARISTGLAADWHGEMRQHTDAHRIDNREEAAAWFADYPWTVDDSEWARGRTEALAWVVSILRNPNPQRPKPQLPECVHCGNQTGLWQPTGDHYPSGAQVLECTGGCKAATPDFFQPGHIYAREHHGRTIEFHVRHIDTAPDCDFPTAFGFRKDPEIDVMLPMDTDDFHGCGWTDVTGAGDA
jgi:hypothetical protein